MVNTSINGWTFRCTSQTAASCKESEMIQNHHFHHLLLG